MKDDSEDQEENGDIEKDKSVNTEKRKSSIGTSTPSRQLLVRKYITRAWLLSLLLLVFSTVLLCMGSIYFKDCPASRMLTIYLVVSGVLGIVQYLFMIVLDHVPKDAEATPMMNLFKKFCFIVHSFILIFLAVWFICGCVWVFEIYPPVYTKSDETEEMKRFCNKTLYLSTFWMLTIYLAVPIILILFFCCLFCFAFAEEEAVHGPIVTV